MNIYYNNVYHTQNFQKQTHYKGVKSWSYALGNKNWLNIKYIKTKQNQKLKPKFFRLFQIFYLVRKQVYKLEFSKKIENL